MSDEKKDNLKIIGGLTLVALVLCLIFWISLVVGMIVSGNKGCYYRYSFNNNGSENNLEESLTTITLRADGNYTNNITSNGVMLDPNTYGKWLDTGISLQPNSSINVSVVGEMSLCKAYIPRYNIQGDSNLDISGDKVAVPRVEDADEAPLSLIFDSKTNKWRNIAEAFSGDRVIVSVSPDRKANVPSVSVYNSFTKTLQTADCREGKKLYNPICGKYTIWGGDYVSSCRYESQCYECNCRRVCSFWDVFGFCIGHWSDECDWCGCYQNVMSDAPESYLNNGTRTIAWSNDLSDLLVNFNPDCGTWWGLIYVMSSAYQNNKRFWFSADDATALLYRIDTNLAPTNATTRGSNYNFASVMSNQDQYKDFTNSKVIYDHTFTGGGIKYLQYRFIDGDPYFADNTGGYVLNIKHTKCRRSNGNAFDDSWQDRGRVQYFVSSTINPNEATSAIQTQDLALDGDGKGSLVNITEERGTLWMRVLNNPNDYVDSTGAYQVHITSTVPRQSFYNDLMIPVVETFKNRITDTSRTIFRNMTCYNPESGNKESCTNFFNYIKAMLILYIMGYGIMFLIGMVQITQTDLIIRVVKVGIVAGLINGNTFDFFNLYVFDFVTKFSDTIIANIGGYNMFTGSHAVTNPFMFLDALLSQIFLSKTFAAQMMSIPFLGIQGLLYFIIIFISLCILVVVLLRAIAIYLMAFLAVALLLSLAPIFLTFILFERTFYLFDKWVKMTIKYMMEPVILLTGIIILTQLYTIYLDMVLGYSVCWKCALAFKLPFLAIPGIDAAFLDVPLFCLNWYGPWGYDIAQKDSGVNMQHVIALLMIAYCIWGWTSFASQVGTALFGMNMGPSATSMGLGMASRLTPSAKQIKKGLKQAQEAWANRTGVSKSKESDGESGDSVSTETKDNDTTTRTGSNTATTTDPTASNSSTIANTDLKDSGSTVSAGTEGDDTKDPKGVTSGPEDAEQSRNTTTAPEEKTGEVSSSTTSITSTSSAGTTANTSSSTTASPQGDPKGKGLVGFTSTKNSVEPGDTAIRSGPAAADPKATNTSGNSQAVEEISDQRTQDPKGLQVQERPDTTIQDTEYKTNSDNNDSSSGPGSRQNTQQDSTQAKPDPKSDSRNAETNSDPKKQDLAAQAQSSDSEQKPKAEVSRNDSQALKGDTKEKSGGGDEE